MKLQTTTPKDVQTKAKFLYKALVKLHTVTEVQQFMEDLTTPAELQAMIDRWQVVALLDKKESYRQIYEKTSVSVTTIGRVARTLNFSQGGYRLALRRLRES